MYLYLHREETHLPSRHISPHIIYDHPWFAIQGQTLIIKGNRPDKNGYAFDGCSPKFHLFGTTLGTPDGPLLANGRPVTYYAALAHDMLYQHAGLHPLSRRCCDRIFHQCLRVAGWPWANLYYLGVRWFGGYWWYRDWQRNKKSQSQDMERKRQFT